MEDLDLDFGVALPAPIDFGVALHLQKQSKREREDDRIGIHNKFAPKRFKHIQLYPNFQDITCSNPISHISSPCQQNEIWVSITYVRWKI